jgi:sulfur relay (sulfurtransferase) complex TusBCD TusD component (DsrE family)
MICNVCKKHATEEHTVFRGTSPVTLKLCAECSAARGVAGHLATIKGTHDKAAKAAAVEALLHSVGK